MVRSAVVGADGVVRVELLLTVAGCPLKDKLRTDITAARGRGARASPASRSTSA